ncbi:hypothetical protein CkaCkLH20_05590 [Colletotrichum karsti]|uniref:Uncharacterized protein n=1 Tax=Colletotrichum karsti TaxID=1095194 RepID=A0A9P6I672_9PEZI|nr:uncharacterized protein CkaCkLH20_05590 [Colletotrichum karsti]KAF9876744.1 hypothetical protein CkaCkLH20_05590 [Colletotrichum karsti]
MGWRESSEDAAAVMAQEKMPELTDMVKRHYMRFPSETWERTRTVLDHHPPHRLFAHVESLISTRKIDDFLKSNEAFHKLAADLYGARHPWLRDADLGRSKWEAFQEFSALTLTEQAREAARDPEAMAKRRRALMVRKIREGRDVDEWRKRLGFEGVAFSEDAIRGGEGGEYGQDEVRMGEGVEIGACLDGKDGKYGPERRLRAVYPKIPHVGIPKAPADGGEAPRNPFTTEWKARDAPDGLDYPPTFDPYYTSNHFIGRTKKYELPKPPEPEDGDEDGDQEMAGQETPQAPSGIAAMATATFGRSNSMTTTRPGVTRTTTLPTGVAVGNIQLVGGSTPTGRPPSGTLPGRFTISTKTDSATTTQPSIVVTGTTPTTHHQPLFEPLSTIREATEPPSEAPGTEARVFTPARERKSPSPTSESPTSDVDMSESPIDDDDAVLDNLDPHDPDWLEKFLARDGTIPADDLEMMPYRGWRIHSPKIQLVRIKNFLADEDIDRTINWERKFAEIAAFLQHCLRLPDAARRSWWADLLEAIDMLRAHWVFEQHHYGEKKLVVDFPQLSGTSTRLPQVQGGRAVVVEKPPAEEVRPRYLLHRVPESIQDVDYQVPATLLRDTFLTWFRQDGNVVWESDSSAPGSGDRGRTFEYQPDFNMALTEDTWFEKGMAGGTETTAADLKSEANFYMLGHEFVAGDVGEVTDVDGETQIAQKMYPEGEVLQRFARYRGTKRAALQQCLTHFNSVENVTIQGPFRKLVLPLTRRQKELARKQAGGGIVYKPQAIASPPKGTKLDPLGISFWHQRMREARYERAEEAQALTDAEQADFAAQTQDDSDPVLTPPNFLGPITRLGFLRESERAMVERWRVLNELRDKLTRAYNRAPRQMLEGVLKNIRYGFEGADSWDMGEELFEHRQRHGKYLPVDDMGLFWVQWLCEPSTNTKMERDALPKLGREFEVFLERMQRLLDDMDMDGLLAVYEKKADVESVTAALNTGLRKGDYILSSDSVETFCKVLADHGRLGYTVDKDGETMISRPECTWHPEHRVNWPKDDDPWDPQTNVFHAANLPDPRAKWSWEEAFANVDFVNLSIGFTKKMLWSRAYRIGTELDGLTRSLRQLDQKLQVPGQRDFRAVALQDVTGAWRNRYEKPVPGRPGPPVTYAAVVKAGDPGKWKEDMTEAEAYEVVRTGIIDELSKGDSALWPARPRFSTVGEDGEEVMTLHRERVWDWARPEVAGVKKQFFSMNRWPVHLQTEKRQEEIRRSVEDEVREKEKKRAAEEAELERIERENEPTEEEERQAMFDKMLSVPYDQGPGTRTRFFPQTEFWGGDTVSQTRALERHLQRMLDEEFNPDDGRAPAKSTTGSRRPGPSNIVSDNQGSIRLPEVLSPDVPKSIPAFLARRAGRLPPGTLREETRAPLARPAPVTIERKRPLFSPVYPTEEPEREESGRRVRFKEVDEPQKGGDDVPLKGGDGGLPQGEGDDDLEKGEDDDLKKGKGKGDDCF